MVIKKVIKNDLDSYIPKVKEFKYILSLLKTPEVLAQDKLLELGHTSVGAFPSKLAYLSFRDTVYFEYNSNSFLFEYSTSEQVDTQNITTNDGTIVLPIGSTFRVCSVLDFGRKLRRILKDKGLPANRDSVTVEDVVTSLSEVIAEELRKVSFNTTKSSSSKLFKLNLVKYNVLIPLYDKTAKDLASESIISVLNKTIQKWSQFPSSFETKEPKVWYTLNENCFNLEKVFEQLIVVNKSLYQIELLFFKSIKKMIDDKEVRLRLYKKFFEERKVTFQPHSAEMLKGDFSGLHKLAPKYLGKNNTGTYLSDVINKGFVTDNEFENFIYTLEEIKDVDFSDSEENGKRAINLVYTYSLAAISTEGNRKLSMYEVPLFIKFPEMFGIILNNVVSFIDKTGKEIPGIDSDKMEYNVRLNISLLLGNYDRKISFLDGFGLGSLKIIRKCITVPNTKVSLSNNSCSIDSITNTLFQILKDKEFSEALKASGEKLDVPDGTKALLIGVRDFYGLQDKLPDSILNSHLREVDKQLFKDKDNFLFSPKRTFVRIYKK